MSLRAKRPRLNQRLSLEMPIRGLSWTGVRFSAPPPIVTGRQRSVSTCLFITYRYRGESNSMQGASVKQTRSVCGERARTPAGGRSRCGFAKRTRGFSAQTISSIWMRCSSNLSRPCAASTEPQTRGESNSVQGAGVKKTPWQRRPGRAFPMAAQAESPSRNPRSDWDVVSG